MYCSRGVDWPVFSSNSGVPPAYMVPGGSPNGFNPFAASCRSVGAELVAQLLAPPLFVVCPAGDGAALLGIVSALRQRWPAVRGMTLVAAGEELPDLPRFADLPSEVERVAVTRADAAAARARVARELGLLAGHAGAAAAAWAHEHGGVAIVSGPGEREFTLDVSP